MKRKRNGFTLVELLAVIVILGIIMVIAIPNVTGILFKNRAATYVEDAKKLATTAEYKLRGSNTGIVKPTNGKCVIMNLAYLDNSEFEKPPYGGTYLKDESFVVIKKNGAKNEYEYYVQLLEEIKEESSLRGIPFMRAADLYKDNSTNLVANVSRDVATFFKMSDYNYEYGVDNTSKQDNVLALIGTTPVDCSAGIMHIYATE